MSTVVLKNITKSFGKTQVIPPLNLVVESDALTVLVGPSGCGKSTLLRMIAGLEAPTSGDIYIDGQRVNSVPPFRRGIAMVFQSYALYPHMTVYENMRFGLVSLGLSKDEMDQRIRSAAEKLALNSYLDRKPKQLSGGQRQRVAMGRALVRQPKVFLFDEPLSNLDAALRTKMRIEIAKLRQQLHATAVYVTHDQVEAMTLADKIVVLRAGHVEQEGPPLEVYHRPINRFVAGFLGSPSMNFIPISDGIPLNISGGAEFGIRPEDLSLDLTQQGVLRGRVFAVEKLGDQALVHLRLEQKQDSQDTTVVARLPADFSCSAEDELAVGFDPKRGHVFDVSGNLVVRGTA